MKITFIQTGGTIDKDYKATKKNHGYNFEISEPAVKVILSKIKPRFNFEIFTATKKDSLDLTDVDRLKIYQKCKNIKNDKIIITHGTDTFIKTAKVLNQIKNKVIILTGAMKPEKFQNSDAMFNVGTAIGAIKFLPNGIYISMNGIVNKWNEYNRSN
jgi:L-asparaginase